MKKSVKKEKSVKKSNTVNLDSPALTLAIAGIFLIFFSSLFIPPLFLILALVFAIIQQKKKPTNIGKSSLILSIVGMVLYIAWIIILFKVLLPLAQQTISQGAF